MLLFGELPAKAFEYLSFRMFYLISVYALGPQFLCHKRGSAHYCNIFISHCCHLLPETLENSAIDTSARKVRRQLMTGWGQAAGWFLPHTSMSLKAVLNCSSFRGVYQHQRWLLFAYAFSFPFSTLAFLVTGFLWLMAQMYSKGHRAVQRRNLLCSLWGGRRALNKAQPCSLPSPPVVFNHE